MGSYRSYRAPAEDGAALVDPDWHAQRRLIREAPPRRVESNIALAGMPLERLAEMARAALLQEARAYTAQFAAVKEFTSRAPLIVSGHQPELFHAGVWFKNLALDEIAKSADGVGVHLLIDSDLCRDPGIRVPTGSVEAPRFETLAMDAHGEAVPYEERRVLNAQIFEDFGKGVLETIAPLLPEPLMGRLWPETLHALSWTDRLGEAVSVGRRRLEGDWGGSTLELPFSRVCDGEPFRRFAWELLRRAGEFREEYNAALHDYRAAHKLRSAAQPLPDLAERGGAVESALWCWSEANPTRRPLLARKVSDGVEISDGAGWSATLSLEPDEAVEQLAALRHSGVKLRSRALATTLYCRWLLADLFLHGIGGAKYDQVTDRLSERLFGAAPPPHATLSATLRLPIDRPADADPAESALRQTLREMKFHPERFLGDDPAASRWFEQKRSAIAAPKTIENAADRHRAITRSNEAMRALLADRVAQAESHLAAAADRRRAAEVLDSREYSFCLFPESDARRRLTALLPREDAL